MDDNTSLPTENGTMASKCSVFNTTEFAIVAGVSAASASVSFIACLGVIALIILFKKYLFFTQRLILYLTIAAMLDSIGYMLHRVDYTHENEATRGFCVFIGFFGQNTSWAELLAICCITVSLFLKATKHKDIEKLEKVYFFMIFIFPLLFNWIPFIQQAYGEAGAWCWIRSLTEEDDDTCTTFKFGVYLRFILWYIPLHTLLIILIVLCIVIIYKVSRDKLRYEGKYDPEAKRLREQRQKEVQAVIWYPLSFLLLKMAALTNRIHGAVSDSPSLPLWYIHAIILPLQGGFIALAFTLDPETRRR